MVAEKGCVVWRRELLLDSDLGGWVGVPCLDYASDRVVVKVKGDLHQSDAELPLLAGSTHPVLVWTTKAAPGSHHLYSADHCCCLAMLTCKSEGMMGAINLILHTASLASSVNFRTVLC